MINKGVNLIMNLIYDIWTDKEYNEYLKFLKKFANKEYRNFQNSLMPKNKRILGINLPILSKIANEVLKGNWRSFVELCSNTYYEETTVKGLIIGMCNVSLLEYTHRIDTFSEQIRNWVTCDHFCIGLKSIDHYPFDIWDYLDSLLEKRNPWQVRLGIVIMLNYYLNDDYINKIFIKIAQIQCDNYYVKTAIAWLLSSAYIKYPNLTQDYLANCKLDNRTYKISIEKILALRQISNEQKLMLETLKKPKRVSASGHSRA